ncbi:mitochondrial pyruvate carrier 2 [Pycnococcus provasolii]|uniref:Mitochondrial pyruvate carrier n=1 Tax=Pycnococcus provasolii TaxID=41880 RepID=A0A830HLD8_9CHLO|nr:mitochondrial pyruvate carrier 2 [Pycnococcus provasolii]
MLAVKNLTTAAARYAPTALVAVRVGAAAMPVTAPQSFAAAAIKSAASLARATPSTTTTTAVCTLRGFAASAGQSSVRRAFSAEAATATATAAKEAAPKAAESWWTSAKFWGGAGAAAAWGMTGSAIYDAFNAGPELISLNMTGVLIVYSSLFARWAWIVEPRNLALCVCHVSNVGAQLNQLRRAMEYKWNNGQEAEVKEMGTKSAGALAALGALVMAGPTLRNALSNAGLGPVSSFAASPAGPFTVHFWAPMSKWLISGASMMDLNRPTDKISLPQYSALTLTGLFFMRYSLLVTPVNYVLCSVNIALFGSSAWHLGRKVKADYIDKK